MKSVILIALCFVVMASAMPQYGGGHNQGGDNLNSLIISTDI